MANRPIFVSNGKENESRTVRVFVPAFMAGVLVSMFFLTAMLQENERISEIISSIGLFLPGFALGLFVMIANPKVDLIRRISFLLATSAGHIVNIYLVWWIFIHLPPPVLILQSFVTALISAALFHFLFAPLRKTVVSLLFAGSTALFPMLMVFMFMEWSVVAFSNPSTGPIVILLLFSPLWLGTLGLVLERYANE